MSSIAHKYYTPEEYLALEREAEYKNEYINGEIYAMSGANRQHNLIAGEILAELITQLKDQPYEVYTSGMRIKVSPIGMYTYGDVSVVCGEPQLEDKHRDTLTNPMVLIEVLSPSTEAYDRGEKFAHYQKLASLTDYVLVSQDKMRIDHFVRYGENSTQWVLTPIDGADGVLRLLSIDCEVALRDIYRRVEFPADQSAHTGPNESE